MGKKKKTHREQKPHTAAITDWRQAGMRVIEGYTYDTMLWDFNMRGADMLFFEWNGGKYCIDRYTDWAFADVTQDGYGDDQNTWHEITPPFKTVEEAFDYPFLDGKSVRERWDECIFYT